ncbi:hypothetical protein IFM89_007012 [Coptis chinensis]|uniref:Transposase, Ptta/En/Spm, plant n=1 Tax=Coptis chinensis TaxID=261450 RepID=A0A835IMV5_9MAGN|nr:hypothetical protein IFM89_007012 [Coptis chinensis]
MEESVRYCMEYMPKARKGSHKRGKFTANKKGRRYILSNLQYEQVRKWLLQHCPQNAEWEAKYQLYLEPYTSHPSRGRRRKRNVATEKPLEYVYMSHPTFDRTVMSEEQYNESEHEYEHEHEHEYEPQHEAPPLVRIEVQFSGDGKAIGPNAAKYASRIGKLTRQHCPPQYSEWTLVPEEAIDFLWKVLERKRNRKSGVKKEEWDLFVDMESTEHAYLRRERGKENRKMMNNPHTTGRRGSARTVEEMVFGKDGRGRVLGLGSGVSKTTLMATAPYKKKAEEAERSKLELQSQIDDLKQQVIDGKKTQMEMQSQVNALLTMQGTNPGAQMRISTNSPSDQVFG